MLLKPKRANGNIETRIADRAKSFFAAFGTIISDFYLEAGIYFVGGFNAALVAWDIYTDLVSKDQPLPYAITLAIIAFIAVEGLAVYLVGAAAKTNNGLLWFFSVVFAAFFTYAHYQEMSGEAGVISQYITLAIPFFVVVGYWARTLKVDTEMTQTQTQAEREEERKRTRQLEDEERARRQKIEDEERQSKRESEAKELAHQLNLELVKQANKQAKDLEKIKAENNRVSTGYQPEIPNRKNGQITGNGGEPEIKPENLQKVNVNRKYEKAEILHRLPGLVGEGLTNVEIGKIVGRNERTIRDYRKQLNGKLKS